MALAIEPLETKWSPSLMTYDSSYQLKTFGIFFLPLIELDREYWHQNTKGVEGIEILTGDE